MPTIRIDDEVWAVLQKRAQAFVDTPNDVLRRDYKLNGTSHPIAPRKVRSQVRRGEKTPEAEYPTPILRALATMGGRGRTQEVVDRVGQLMGGRLNEYDRQTLAAGEVRWRNTAEWARNTMAHKMNPALLNPSSPHGWWEITQAGREYLESN